MVSVCTQTGSDYSTGDTTGIANEVKSAVELVYAQLGSGHREKPYTVALAHMLNKRTSETMRVARMEVVLPISLLDGSIVGHCMADILIENSVIEVKVSDSNARAYGLAGPGASHLRQLKKYVELVHAEHGFLVTFYANAVQVQHVTSSGVELL
jgi:GxxExxY protein